MLPRPSSIPRPILPLERPTFSHPIRRLQALRWITQTCVAFDGLCCVASTILAATDRADMRTPLIAEEAPQCESGSVPMHTDAPWESVAPEEQPTSMDVSGGDSGGAYPEGSLLDLLLQRDITLSRSVLRHEGRQEAHARVGVYLRQEPPRRTISGRHAPRPPPSTPLHPPPPPTTPGPVAR